MADAKKQAAKDAAKEAKAMKRKQRFNNYKQLWAAFKVQRKQDKKLIPLMLLAIVGITAVFFLLGLIWNIQWIMLLLGIGFGLIAALYIFTKRVERSAYEKASGQPGAAGWVLENMRNGVGMVWLTKTAVAATTQMDTVHRVVGLCGIVLVGEGTPHRVRPLMAQQKKHLNRVAGQVPLYEVMVGENEGEVSIRGLQRHLTKLPRNLKKDEAYALNTRLESTDRLNTTGTLPKGPVPKQAKVSGMNRRARRAAERQNRG